MTNALGKLVKILPPPKKPVEAHGDWRKAEAKLGTALPDDYKAFIEAYGTGAISYELRILSPFTRHGVWKLHSEHRQLTAWYEKGLGRPLDGSPLFPEPGGLLVCGGSVDGDQIFWRVQGSPNDWHIVVSHRQMLEVYEYPKMSLTEFLLRLVQRQIPKYRIPLIDPPYTDPNAPYEFCTWAEVRRKESQ